ncbi:PH domain-containing protein [Clostridium perfringens]
MGFFDLKATCSVCNNEVGLNRFKVKKSNAWICPKCLKKAGGTTNINVSKMTIEEIKKIIEEKQSNIEKRKSLIEKDPLSTAEGMYKYCLDNKFGSGWNEKWGIKHFKLIEENLLPNEEVKMVFIGLHNYISSTKHDGNFAYAITNKRIIMAQKKQITGENFQTISLDNINDITFKSGVLLGILTVDTIKETFNIGLDKGSAKSINSTLHSVVDNIKNISITPEIKELSTNSFSIADELKKYKELLDLGVLTQDEFEKQKNKLLNK